MAFNSWLTSDGLIDAVKRKIAIPIAQGVMSPQDILDFATEELLIAQVPSVLSYHEEYFVWVIEIPLVQNKGRYPIPERAIGMKLRNVFFKDSGDNLFPMTRVNPEDKGYYQRDSVGASTLYRYYLQGNDIVIAERNVNSVGHLYVEIFIRPNRLVPDSRAAYIGSFLKDITINNASLVSGDSISINGTSFVAGTDFAIGASSALTAANLATAIANSSVVSGATSNTNITTVIYSDITTPISVSNNSGSTLSSNTGLNFTGDTPTNFADGEMIDILQTRPGHSMRVIDITIPVGGVSGSSISVLSSRIPESVLVGDYVALAGEGIIPMIPTDLHTALADRTCARILAAIGDKDGVESINQKLSETEVRQGNLLNNRVEGSLPKVIARHSLLRIGKISNRRNF